MRKYLPLVFWLLLAPPLTATSYFVTQSGAGSQNGLSLANAWSVATYNASATPTGGDTVFFSGTITSTITVGTSGTGNGASRLTLDFTGTCGGCSSVTLSASGTRINFNNQSFVTLNGTGSTISADTNNDLISCAGQSGHDLTINGFTYTGNTTGTSTFVSMGTCNNVTITNNTIDNIGTAVNAFSGAISGITIRNNFMRTSLDLTADDDVLQLADARNVIIEGNKLINPTPGNVCCHNDVIQTFQSGASTHQNPSNWIIRYNWIEAAQQVGTGGNTSWMEMEGFTGQPAVQVYGNVFVGTGVAQSGGNGMTFHTGTLASDTYYVYNNTFWAHQNPLNPIRLGVGDGPGTVFLRNNAAGDDTTGQSIQVLFSVGATFDYNYFYQYNNCSSTYTGSHGSCSLTPAAFASTSGNNFSPASGSVLINAGDPSIGAAYNQGIAPGATWPNPALNTRSTGNWDVGAFQHLTTTGPNPVSGLSAVAH